MVASSFKDKGWGRDNQLINGVLTLFKWVSTHPNETQTYGTLSEVSGIPKTTLYEIINYSRYYDRRFYCDLQRRTGYPMVKHFERVTCLDTKTENDLLLTVSEMFGYDYRILRERKGKIIDVVKINNIDNMRHKMSLIMGTCYNEDLTGFVNVYRPDVE